MDRKNEEDFHAVWLLIKLYAVYSLKKKLREQTLILNFDFFLIGFFFVITKKEKKITMDEHPVYDHLSIDDDDES